jgi:hypothetical protein
MLNLNAMNSKIIRSLAHYERLRKKNLKSSLTNSLKIRLIKLQCLMSS